MKQSHGETITEAPVILVKQKSVYGRILFYPENSYAEAIVSLSGRKCLRALEIARLIDAGFDVQIVHDEVEL